jgi:hypothetical protein
MRIKGTKNRSGTSSDVLRARWQGKIECLEKYLRENWTPTQEEIQWLYVNFRILKVGGTWLDPNGSVFRKTDQSTLELEIVVARNRTDGNLPLVHDIDKAIVMTKIIGGKLGITVKLEPHTLVDSHNFSVRMFSPQRFEKCVR